MGGILVDPAELVRLETREGGPVYFLRPPRIADRATFRRAVRVAGGRLWSHLDLAACCKEGIAAVLADEEDAPERDGLIAEFETYMADVEAALAAWRDDQSDELWDEVVEAMKMPPVVEAAWRQVETAYLPLRERMADNGAFAEISGMVAARMFLRGWEGVDSAFRTKLGEVPDDVLEAIPSRDIVAIGRRIGELLEPDQATMGNSKSPSIGPVDPTPSQAASTPPESVH